KDITVSGIVTAVKKGTTKNGKPFATVSIEDYTDSFKTTIFSDSLVNFANYLSVGYLLMIKGKVQQKQFNNSQELEFKITGIHLLSEVREKLVKKIQVKITLSALSEKIINEMQQLAEANKGKTLLKFCVFDPVEKISVELFSRKYRINVSHEITEYLERLDIEYKIE
ncbi:MAG: OB-fold nucleic acid binding domain-containing protein, partial [Bacteroidales bacterium]|nr:OB-fold nucleic acid binding domain-containing protein [Bacteroidales bacterium]